ncbi:hypothetical protein DFQ30_008552 [Apophysomyces sp. BC1015]|nr:hypothetical protein DFQ30_008552 [Apophysomyces sp. BC1015]
MNPLLFKHPKNMIFRPLKPRPCGRKLLVHSVEFLIERANKDGKQGRTQLKILPSEICVSATDLITMIENQREEIVKDGKMISRQDILTAAEALLQGQFPTLDDNTLSSTSRRYRNVREPRRPPNAFMLYSCQLRRRIRAVFPEYSNAEASKLLGAMWRSANADVKQKYIKMAEQQRRWHSSQFPHYTYKKSSSKNAHRESSVPFTDTPTPGMDWLEEMDELVLQSMNLVTTETQHQLDNITAVPFLDSDFFGHPQASENFEPDDWQQICDTIAECFPDFPDQTFKNAAWESEVETAPGTGSSSRDYMMFG